MKKIELTRGKYALVDDRDYARLSQFRWYAVPKRKTWYAARGNWGGRPQKIYMHRALMPGIKIVDHRNCDGLDNRRINLRDSSHSQNLANRGLDKNNTSGFTGVVRNHKRWAAQINVRCSHLYLGTYDALEEAALAYMLAAILYFGEFARA